MKKISFQEIDEILKNNLEGDIIRAFNSTKDPELKIIFATIRLINGIVKKQSQLSILKLSVISCLKRANFRNEKVDINIFLNAETKEEIIEWLGDNLVGKVITIKRGNKFMISDFIDKLK